MTCRVESPCGHLETLRGLPRRLSLHLGQLISTPGLLLHLGPDLAAGHLPNLLIEHTFDRGREVVPGLLGPQRLPRLRTTAGPNTGLGRAEQVVDGAPRDGLQPTSKALLRIVPKRLECLDE